MRVRERERERAVERGQAKDKLSCRWRAYFKQPFETTGLCNYSLPWNVMTRPAHGVRSGAAAGGCWV